SWRERKCRVEPAFDPMHADVGYSISTLSASLAHSASTVCRDLYSSTAPQTAVENSLGADDESRCLYRCGSNVGGRPPLAPLLPRWAVSADPCPGRVLGR